MLTNNLTASPYGEINENCPLFPKFKSRGSDCNKQTAEETSIFTAIASRRIKAVKLSLTAGTDILQENEYGQKAIDLAYNMNFWSCVLLLLKHGSTFPEMLNTNDIPESEHELLAFIDRNEKICELIANGPTKSVAQLIDNDILKHSYRNTKNQSALTIAFFNKQFETFVLLKAKEFEEFWYEPPVDIDGLSYLEKLILKNTMRDFIKNYNNI